MGFGSGCLFTFSIFPPCVSVAIDVSKLPSYFFGCQASTWKLVRNQIETLEITT